MTEKNSLLRPSYGLEKSRGKNIDDAGCKRCIGSLVNHTSRTLVNIEFRPSHTGRGEKIIDFIVLWARNVFITSSKRYW
jgi:hypothetical protein